MTIDEAVGRVEACLSAGVIRIHESHSPSNAACREALRILLAHAKEQPRYALGEDERKELQFHLDLLVRQGWENKTVDALTAAIALQAPFTRQDIDDILLALDSCLTSYNAALPAKLRAYIEARQSE